jgi:hypothetical protein
LAAVLDCGIWANVILLKDRGSGIGRLANILSETAPHRRTIAAAAHGSWVIVVVSSRSEDDGPRAEGREPRSFFLSFFLSSARSL